VKIKWLGTHVLQVRAIGASTNEAITKVDQAEVSLQREVERLSGEEMALVDVWTYTLRIQDQTKLLLSR